MDNYWIWGVGSTRSLAAGAELEWLGNAPPGWWQGMVRSHRRANPGGGLPVGDLAPGALRRTRRLRPSAPGPGRLLTFGARDLRQMANGLVVRTRERGTKASAVAFEDHGLWGRQLTDNGRQMFSNGLDEVVLFFGRDAVTSRNFGIHRASFRRLSEGLQPGATIYLLHCYAFADGGRLAKMISHATGAPVVGMKDLQTIGNQRHEGQAFQAFRGGVRPIRSLPQNLMHFD